MTLEEKIEHLQAVSMEEARAEGNAIIDNYRAALEKVLEDHKEEALLQSETRIKGETECQTAVEPGYRQGTAGTEAKQGKIQQELKDKIFEETMSLVSDYMKTEAYEDFLIKCIRKAVRFAAGAEMTIYINPSDEQKRSDLEDDAAHV